MSSSSAEQQPPCLLSPTAKNLVPYIPSPIKKTGRPSTVEARKKNLETIIRRKTITCFQYNVLGNQTGFSSKEVITVCAACSLFENEKVSNRWLRHLEDNHPFTCDVPKKFRCRTLWTYEGVARTPVSSSSFLVTNPVSSSSPIGCTLPAARNDPPILSKGHLAKSPTLGQCSNSSKTNNKKMTSAHPDFALSSPPRNLKALAVYNITKESV